MASIVVDKTLFWIWWFVIIIFGSLFVKGFLMSGVEYDLKLDTVENNLIADKVVKCFSEDNGFGIIDRAKTNNIRLGKCFGNKYNMKISFSVLSAENLADVELGKISNDYRTADRFVIVDGKGAKLEVAYNAA